jgi:SRSO17 transposase
MERRFEVRMEELLDAAVVDPAVFADVQPRLTNFLEPFVACLREPEQRKHAQHYVTGLVSNLERKNVESIAYGQDLDRLPLQKFMGCAPWDERPLLDELARQVGQELGDAEGVLVFDPSAHPKKGTASVGVQRQWCGRLGKVENCQVGVYLGYVGRREHALVDVRLYLPQEWAKDNQRRKQAGVPQEVRFQIRHDQCLEMLDANGPRLPHGWIAGDDEIGRSTRFRRDLRARNERYLLDVPANTLVQDQDAAPPPYAGRGRKPQVPFVRAERWCAALPATAWTTVEVRPGEKGPLVVEMAKARVVSKTDRRRADAVEVLVVFRARQADGTCKHDYSLSNAPWDTPLAEFARVRTARQRIEECFQRAKGEAGLSDYEVRTWRGWHHHQALSLMATWFLTQETLRGKKNHARVDGAATPLVYRRHVGRRPGLPPTRSHLPHEHAESATERAGAALSLETTQPLAAVTG